MKLRRISACSLSLLPLPICALCIILYESKVFKIEIMSVSVVVHVLLLVCVCKGLNFIKTVRKSEDILVGLHIGNCD